MTVIIIIGICIIGLGVLCLKAWIKAMDQIDEIEQENNLNRFY